MSQNPQEFNVKEPIPGYRTIELIGRGGYGEVWRTIAPGGLAKALKIVYGDVDPDRAAGEMKALARIKDVRHPLLLSIERIEITCGNLVIVTELADYSLKEYFHRQSKLHAGGVPQHELIRFVDDSAEALDFLYVQYSLQHLDVKPENILLLSGRAKVGDFGLIKNLYERAASIVGGLTPTYSPPELFDGKPSRHSDQYSLAIVYMQMLTGALPFDGANTAHLAAQHLRGVPDLSPLPRAQRPVIARALSKDPAHRFDSCVEMVTALRAALNDSGKPAAGSAVPVVDIANREQFPSTSGSSNSRRGLAPDRNRFSEEGSPAALDTVRPQSNTEAQSPSDRASREKVASESQPTIILGIGGTAVKVIGKLLDRLHDRMAEESEWPPLQVVLMDSDTTTLTSRFDSEGRFLQLIPMRLRNAESFGPRTNEVLHWLNRRWFYGIPRDLTTDHYRPLGRLALVTHAARVKEAIRTAFDGAAENLTGRCRDLAPPRVIVVGSICGGTGGGAILDVAYAARAELKRRGLPDEDVQGVLLYSTPRGNLEHDKSLANAYATLKELHHFSRAGAHYPGEASLDVPPFHGDNKTFGRTSVLNMGDGLSEEEWELAAEKVAEFCYCSTFTPVSEILDRCEEHVGSAGAELLPPLAVSSCDALALGAGTPRLVSQLALRTCVDVVSLLRNGGDPTAAEISGPTVRMTTFASQGSGRNARVEAAVKQKLVDCGLGIEQFLGDGEEILKLESGTDTESYLRRLVQDALSLEADGWSDDADRIDDVVARIDRVLSCEASGDEAGEVGGGEEQSLYHRILARLTVRGGGRATTLLEWIRDMLNVPTVRVEGARQYAAAAKVQLQETRERLTVQMEELQHGARSLIMKARGTTGAANERGRRSGWSSKSRGPHERVRVILNHYAEIRTKETLLSAVAKQLRLVEAEIATLLYQIDNLSRNLKLLAERLEENDHVDLKTTDECPSRAAIIAARYQQLLAEQLRKHRRDIARKVGDQIDQRLLNGSGGLRRFLEPESELWTILSGPLDSAARRAVLECTKEIVCRLIQDSTADSSDQTSGGMIRLIADALREDSIAPARAGNLRILVVPAEVNASKLGERLGADSQGVTIVNGRTCDVALCTVRGGVALEQFANEIIRGVDVFKELAGRLHCRIDVQWTPISDRTPPPCPEPSAAVEPLPVTPTAIIALPRMATLATSHADAISR